MRRLIGRLFRQAAIQRLFKAGRPYASLCRTYGRRQVDRALRVALLLALLVCGGCAKPHPVMPAPAHWQLPKAYAHCQKAEQVTWPDGRVTVVVECPTGALFLDKKSGALVDPDSLDFRGKK